MDNAFNYIKDHKDDTEACYPYVAHVSQLCVFGHHGLACPCVDALHVLG